METPPRPTQRIWSNEIPSRNPNFTGRAAELAPLSDNLFSRQHPARTSHLRHGRNRENGTGDRVHTPQHRHLRNHLVDPRRASGPGTRRACQAWPAAGTQRRPPRTAHATGRWRPYLRRCSRVPGRAGCWSSTTPPTRLICRSTFRPAGRTGTSSLPRGSRTGRATSVADSIEVSPFTDAESVSFLRRTVPGLAEGTQARRRRGRAAGQRGQSAGHDAWPPAHRRRARGRLPRRDRPERRANTSPGSPRTPTSCSASSRPTPICPPPSPAPGRCRSRC